MAVIMDEFTLGCYSPECDTVQITPHGFKQEIEAFQPDFLFIESVWRGKDNLWRYKLNDDTREFYALIEFCHERRVPVVFWSKEDPVHFGVFLKVAQAADFVFTTDADCVGLYKTCVGHDRVYYLPFAAQPKIHNPLEEYERQNKFCFAGSFYVRYQERSNVFMKLIPFMKTVGIDIYDRNFKKGSDDGVSVASPAAENYYFPDELKNNILGSLPYSEISRAYKGYRYGVNMTSMVYSSTMFARRVFELLACNTPAISNYSRGIRLLLGDLLVCSDNEKEIERLFNHYCSAENYRKFRLAGLRHVLSEHLYEDRLGRIVSKVFGCDQCFNLPEVLVLCFDSNDKVQSMFVNQTYENKHLLFLDDGSGASLSLENYDYVTIFSPDHYYGKNYLKDFALATRFAPDETVIGKVAGKQYVRVRERVRLDRQMVKTTVFNGKATAVLVRNYCCTHEILALDEFNFSENSDCIYCHDEANDMEVFTGLPLEQIYSFTDSLKPIEFHETCDIPLSELFCETNISPDDKTTKYWDNGCFTLRRDVEDDDIVWLRTDKNYTISDYTIGSRIGFKTDISDKTGNVRCQIEYYDENGAKLQFLNFAIGGFSLLRISDRAKTFKLVFRMRGRSGVTFKRFSTASPNSYFSAPLLLADTVFITEGGYENLLDFIREQHIDLLKVDERSFYLPYSEDHGVNIISCEYEAIKEFVTPNVKNVLLHHPSEKLMKLIEKNSVNYELI